MIQPLRLKPIFKERVWGGNRLLPGSPAPIGEAWVVYEECQVEGGEWHGRTLGDVALQAGVDLLGQDVLDLTGPRFPLLVKLLHSREWLSVQVHPNDEQASAFEGPGHFGKTEAWHVLEAEPDARVVYGLDGNWSSADLERMVQLGDLERALRFQVVSKGDTLFTPAGCVHAIGPGLFIYEVQQTSDITYRLYDWNRPASEGRSLHVDKALSVIGTCGNDMRGNVASERGQLDVLTQCEYFTLEAINQRNCPDALSTEGRSFHALTVTSGNARVHSGGVSSSLGELETIVIPASTGQYSIEPEAAFSALLSRVC